MSVSWGRVSSAWAVVLLRNCRSTERNGCSLFSHVFNALLHMYMSGFVINYKGQPLLQRFGPLRRILLRRSQQFSPSSIKVSILRFISCHIPMIMTLMQSVLHGWGLGGGGGRKRGWGWGWGDSLGILLCWMFSCFSTNTITNAFYITTSYTNNFMTVATPFELQIQPTWIIWKLVINDSWFVSLIWLKTHFIIFQFSLYISYCIYWIKCI